MPTQNPPNLLFSSKYHLLPLIPPLLELLLGVLPFVLLSFLNRLDLLTFDLPCFLHNLRDMSVAFDAFNFRHVCVALSERFVVLKGLTLLGGFYTFAFRGLRAPETDVAVVGAGDCEMLEKRE